MTWDSAAERAVVGAALRNGREYEGLRLLVAPEDFGHEQLARLFGACGTIPLDARQALRIRRAAEAADIYVEDLEQLVTEAPPDATADARLVYHLARETWMAEAS